MEGLRNYNVKV